MNEELAFSPECEDETADFVKDSFHESKPMKIIGGGTKPIGNSVTARQYLSTRNITGINDYDPGALTIVVKAGTSVKELDAVLAKENQHLSFEPADYRSLLGVKGNSTIGGVVAAGVSGPRRIQCGRVRDSLIGVRFINGEGEIIKSGGRVMKNVTGYDLTKLMPGSFGTLGILSEVAFKLLSIPERTASFVIYGLKDDEAIKILTLAMGSPYDISGAAHIPKHTKNRSLTLIRIEGFGTSISYRADKLKELISSKLPKNAELLIQLNKKTNASLWKEVRDVEMFAVKSSADKSSEIWRLTVKPTDGPLIIDTIRQSMDCTAMYDCAGGLIWLRTSSEKNAAQIVRDAVDQFGGYATLIRADANRKRKISVFHPEQKLISEISEKLRLQFDPHSILNRGRLNSWPMNLSENELLGD